MRGCFSVKLSGKVDFSAKVSGFFSELLNSSYAQNKHEVILSKEGEMICAYP